MPLLLILAIISTEPLKANEQSVYNSCWVSNGIDKAPENVQPRIDLPDVQNYDGGVLIPIETASYLSTKLRCLWRWPEVCNSIIDANRQISDTRIKDLTKQIETLKNIDSYKKDNVWLWVVLGSSGALLLGLSAGVLIMR